MFIEPKYTEKKDGAFTFGTSLCVKVPPALANDTLAEILKNFCLGITEVSLVKHDRMEIIIGNADIPELDGHAYAINVCESGVSAVASDEKYLANAFMTVLQMIKPVCTDAGSERFEIPCMLLRDTPNIERRMIHLCVFPETTLIFVKRFVRLCALLRYTHIVIEFWGTYKYKCLKELAWESAFTYDEVKPIMNEARDMGLEIIPMFQHLGHASASRIAHGKHVVLDQNPRLATLFDENGWTWDITKPEVRKLLRDARAELCELCGDGEYFHIGCDEAYLYREEPERNTLLLSYLNEITEELCGMGRRPIMWGDMLLCKEDVNGQSGYATNAASPKVAKMLTSGLDRRMVIADWHYDVFTAPFLSSTHLNDLGFDTLTSPWYTTKNIDAAVKTAKLSYGFMLTTWHTLSMRMMSLAYSAALMWQAEGTRVLGFDYFSTGVAALLRKACPINGSYSDAGWAKHQVSVLWN